MLETSISMLPAASLCCIDIDHEYSDEEEHECDDDDGDEEGDDPPGLLPAVGAT